MTDYAANELTRDDLPDASVVTDKYGAIGPMYFPAVDDYRDAVVAHLNASGGLPAADGRWRRAHSIVEQERDQARESLRRLRAETDFDLFTVRDQLKQCRGEREQMTRDRDEWKARAEKDATVIDGLKLALANRASRAEATDQAVFIVRESQIAAVKVTEAGQSWRAGDTGIPLPWKANKVREMRDECAAEWAELEAIARAIETDAEPADPLLDKAQEFAALADWELTDREAELLNKVAAHVLGKEQ